MTKTKRGTDWLLVVFTVSSVLLVAVSLAALCLFLELRQAKNELNANQQQLRAALGLNPDMQPICHNTWIMDANCTQQLESADFLQIRLVDIEY